MVTAYWQIGRRIVEEEQGGATKATYGEGLLKALSKDLTAEFGKGFSLANLKNLRKFYLTFPDREKSYTLCSLSRPQRQRTTLRLQIPHRPPHRGRMSHARLRNATTTNPANTTAKIPACHRSAC